MILQIEFLSLYVWLKLFSVVITWYIAFSHAGVINQFYDFYG